MPPRQLLKTGQTEGIFNQCNHKYLVLLFTIVAHLMLQHCVDPQVYQRCRQIETSGKTNQATPQHQRRHA